MQVQPVAYLTTHGQLVGDESFCRDGVEADAPVRQPLDSLHFTPDGRGLLGSQASAEGGRALYLWDLDAPEVPAVPRWVQAIERPSALLPCTQGALDVQLGATGVHWGPAAESASCARVEARKRGTQAFDDFAASFVYLDDAANAAQADAPLESPVPLFALGPQLNWRAALLDDQLLLERVDAEGGPRQRHVRLGAAVGRVLALWFCGGQLVWLTRELDSAGGGVRSDVWRQPLLALWVLGGGGAVHVAKAELAAELPVVSASGRFVGLMAAGETPGSTRPYVVDCAGVHGHFVEMMLPQRPRVPRPDCTFVWAPDVDRLLLRALHPGRDELRMYDFSALATRGPLAGTRVRGRALTLDVVGAGDSYALGSGARALAHASSLQGDAAVVLYTLGDEAPFGADAAS